MATAVGLIASIAQLADYTLQTFQYVDSVKNAPKERTAVAREATSLYALLIDLRYKVEDAGAAKSEEWLTAVRSLKPRLEELKTLLEEVAGKLVPEGETSIKRLGKNLVWPWNEKKCRDILSRIERLKTLIHFALNESLSYVFWHMASVKHY